MKLMTVERGISTRGIDHVGLSGDQFQMPTQATEPRPAISTAPLEQTEKQLA
jgi:hypothetical protein